MSCRSARTGRRRARRRRWRCGRRRGRHRPRRRGRARRGGGGAEEAWLVWRRSADCRILFLAEIVRESSERIAENDQRAWNITRA
ncbi:Os01g0690732 [Oryza sativa Japonica Group]|uniref:Os01g0690732 protein n=1 Tax=Oryza sativa subsp. japonica TaxID=39947 RepID=C7IX79_ORYSJ|nr:Os01g0690732 [Oryza sativa Japonica Group]|eukprot:NP_001172512.1 Os01g0690732 [Oryza sativa Japonica Group]